MEPDELMTLIERRDETINDLGRYLPNTIASILDGNEVTLFDGITIRKIESEPLRRDDPNGWYDELRTERVIFAVKDGDVESYFRAEVEYDSWDNGETDEWKFKNSLERVQKVAVEKYVWEVAY